MPNVIVEISREIGRVRNLLARLDPRERELAIRAIAAGEWALAMNSFDSMRDAIDDLKQYGAPADAPGGDK